LAGANLARVRSLKQQQDHALGVVFFLPQDRGQFRRKDWVRKEVIGMIGIKIQFGKDGPSVEIGWPVVVFLIWLAIYLIYGHF
jgi:hypothetical protein